ncbi:MAG TPA: ATP-binding protein [Candidatus Wujingus californicus]|uniref:ATP-binding protein n=1 Tax=Candidatus Wujingus californicus TaxID=3367618 RepID=UPI0040267789
MDKKRPTCFVSYCREGADNNSIQHLIQQLRQASERQIEFFLDADLDAGSKLGSFMDLLRITDGVIILLTPEYKTRVEERKGGVYREFSEIVRRYQELEDEANRSATTVTTVFKQINPPFCLMPLIFAGSFERSCPKEISENLCLDFSTYRAHRRDSGQLYITQQTTTRFNKQIDKLVGQISTYHVSRSAEVSSSFEDLLSSFFEQTKHEHLRGDPKLERVFEHVFVKTYAFKKVRRQTSYLLIGRKGSGKSTIVHYLARESADKYKEIVEINVNNFDLEYLYLILSTRQVHAELGTVISQVSVFEVVWELFLYVCCMHVVVAEHRKGKLKEGQEMHLPIVSAFLTEMIQSDVFESQFSHRAAFRWCYAKIVNQLDSAIRSARDEPAGFNYDITRLLEPEHMLRVAVTTECLDAFNAILHQCTRRFLISLDGFDTAFEEFRIKTQQKVDDPVEKQRRTEYEIDWLRGFAHVVIDMKSSARKTPLANLADFCATIPKDRFIEIRDYERDSYVYIGKCHEIRWSAIELAILLYKRLEVLGAWYSDQNKPPHVRLDEMLKTKFPYIPLETVTTVGEVDYALPIFIDVLRHTFWRPREILIYFAKIIAVLRDIRKRNMEITQFAIGKCIADTTREIIKTKFFSEFQRHCINLKQIIEQFRRQRQLLTKSEVERLIGGIGFKFVDRREPVTDFDSQIRFLYEIGFLGLEADRKLVQRLKLLHSDMFWFNAGDETFEVLLNEGFADCRFIIHPVFYEFLDLDVRKQKLTLNFDWTYLQQQEAHVVAPA